MRLLFNTYFGVIATTESELFCSLSVSETRLIVRSFVARSGVGGFTATDEAVLTRRILKQKSNKCAQKR